MKTNQKTKKGDVANNRTQASKGVIDKLPANSCIYTDCHCCNGLGLARLSVLGCLAVFGSRRTYDSWIPRCFVHHSVFPETPQRYAMVV